MDALLRRRAMIAAGGGEPPVPPEPQQHTITLNLSSYDELDYSYSSLTNPSNAYDDTQSSTYANIEMTTGDSAETYMYFKFDTSAIPLNATIDSVSISVKSSCSTGTANVPTRYWQLCSGTTGKSETVSIPNPSAINTLSSVPLSRTDISDLRLYVYGQRGWRYPDTAYYLRIFGVELTITYTA